MDATHTRGTASAKIQIAKISIVKPAQMQTGSSFAGKRTNCK